LIENGEKDECPGRVSSRGKKSLEDFKRARTKSHVKEHNFPQNLRGKV